MKAVESSLSYRGIVAAYRWAGRCVAASLTGRGLVVIGRSLRPALAGSLSFGTARIRSTPLAVGPAVAGVLMRRRLGGLSTAAPLSAFAAGDWARVLGAAGLGLGCGMISGRPAAGAVLVMVGLVLVAAGPWCVAVIAASGVARLFGRVAPPAGRPAGGLSGIQRATWAAVVLALAAGALAGAGSNTRAVIALAAIVALAAAVLWRPQLILLAVAAFPWVDWAARNALGGIGPLWDEALLVIGVALILWSILVLGRDVPRSVPVTLPVLFMLAAAVASVVVSHVPNGPALYGLRVLFQPILFYFVGFLIPKDRRWVRWASGVFIAATTLLALHGLYQYVTHAPMPGAWVDASETGITTRAFSVVGNPNLLGGMLVMGSLVSISLALSRATAGFRRLALVAVCIVQLGGLAVTFSRGAWIGFAVGLVALILLAYRRYLVGVAGAAVVVWFAAPQVFIERLLFSFSSAYAAKSMTGLGRLWRWESALQHIVDKPLLGLGLGTFGGTTAALWGYWSIWVDNYYLQMAAEGGLLLLVFFFWLMWRNLKGLVRSHAVATDPYLKALAAGVFGAVVAIIVADFFEADWEGVAVAVGFWFMCGLAMSAVLAQPAEVEK